MCLNLLQSFWVPNSNGEITGHCRHVFPVGVHCYTRNSTCVGSHNSGVSTGRDVKYSKITLSEASEGGEKDIKKWQCTPWRYLLNIYQWLISRIKTNSLLMFLPVFSFHPQRSLLLLQAPHVLKIRSGHRMFIYYWFRTNYIQITFDGKHCLPASRYTCSKSSGHSLKYPSSDPMTQKVSFTLMQFIARPVPGTKKNKLIYSYMVHLSANVTQSSC